MADFWNWFFLEPMLNSLLVLYALLFQNLVLAVLVFTVLVRLLILPLTLQQLRSSKAMMELQPRIEELRRRYGKDRERMGQEQMRLYREHGVNPLGCLVPTLIQFPVWIGLYWSIIYAMAATPDALLTLSQRLYPWLGDLQALVPLHSRFLWLDLGQPDPTLILPVLVAGSMWVQQKMMTLPTSDERQRQMNQTMQWMMPLMFGFFTMQFASGLAIYWFVSNIISMVIQYFVTGWGSLRSQPALGGSVGALATPDPALDGGSALGSPTPAAEERDRTGRKRSEHGKSGSKRQDRRRGGRSRPETTRTKPR